MNPAGQTGNKSLGWLEEGKRLLNFASLTSERKKGVNLNTPRFCSAFNVTMNYNNEIEGSGDHSSAQCVK